MQYFKLGFSTSDQDTKDVLIAILSEAGYEGFEETEEALFAYISEEQFEQQQLDGIAGQIGIKYSKETIAQQNWNQTWEQNFQPVIVDGFCTVRADFHKLERNTPYEVIITPKMSFGTGHHATTQLMITEMQHLNLKDKSVFDFGTGTGILAILAEMLGAKEVLAIDNDEWSYDNVIENIERNHSSKIIARKASIENIAEHQFEVILANINRHILLNYIKMMYDKMTLGGKILMSGILIEDIEIVKESALKAGLKFMHQNELNNWILLVFEK